MAQVDTSMYSTQFPPPQKPLEMVQGYANAGHALVQNQLLQRELGAQKEFQEILSASTDPHTGQRDYSKANELLQHSQFGSINAPKLLDMQNVQDQPQQVFNPDTNSYEYRPLQNLQLIAKQQSAAAQRKLKQNGGTVPNALMQGDGGPNPQPDQPQPDNQLTGQSQPSPDGADPNEVGPPMSQEMIDGLHEHNQGIISALTPLANDNNVDHKKVIRAVSDLVANPKVKFNAMDGASALSSIPFGPNGTPPDSAAIQARLRPILAQQKQHEAQLQQRFPSSQQIQARRAASNALPPAAPVNLQEANGEPVQDNVSAQPKPGFTSPLTKSRQNYDEVTDTASKIPGTLAAYNEVINLNKQGALTGTRLADAYQVAARNDPLHILSGANDEATKSQEIQKWLAQGLIQNGMPGSDARLQELQHGNLNPDQLPETIKELAPFFKAVAQGAIKKQNYYNKTTANGSNLTNEPAALQHWNNNYDPRWIEFDELGSSKEKHEFLVKHPDMINKKQNYKALQQMGVTGGQ